jgi:hypothetical protein
VEPLADVDRGQLGSEPLDDLVDGSGQEPTLCAITGIVEQSVLVFVQKQKTARHTTHDTRHTTHDTRRKKRRTNLSANDATADEEAEVVDDDDHFLEAGVETALRNRDDAHHYPGN